jgi:predicted dehydrogenase
MEFPSGALSHIELSWLAPSKLRRTVVVGSQKMVVYDDSSPEPVRVFDSGVTYEDPETFGQYQLSYRTGDVVSPKLDTAEPLAVEMAEFVAAARAGRAPEGHLEIARNVVRIAEAADASLAAGGTEVAIGLEAPQT